MNNDKGFSLIELLVVILIIGILTAIAIPAFLSQRNRAWEAEVKSAANAVATHIIGHYVSEEGDYPEKVSFGDPDNTTDVELVLQKDEQYRSDQVKMWYKPTADKSGFDLCVESTNISGQHIKYDSDIGSMTDWDSTQDCSTALVGAVEVK